MKQDEPVATRFRLLNVGIEEFAWLDSTASATDLDDIEIKFAFELSAPDRLVGIIPRFTFKQKERDVLLIQPVLRFELHEEDWLALVIEEDRVRLTPNLLQHLAVIAVGFTRGILYEKVQKQANFQQLMLPVIPVTDLITEPLTFPLS